MFYVCTVHMVNAVKTDGPRQAGAPEEKMKITKQQQKKKNSANILYVSSSIAKVLPVTPAIPLGHTPEETRIKETQYP